MSELKTLVPDINKLLSRLNNNESILEDLKAHLPEFHKDLEEVVEHWATPETRTRDDGLRMSNLGRPDRRLWFDLNADESKDSEEPPHTQVKFLYGHILEQVAILLIRAAGHEVSSTQKEVDVDGIKGHMDSVVDGEVVDIKTASSFAFRKFKDGKLSDDDPFGYLTQLAGYEEHEGTDEGGFFVINKETGELCLYIPEDLDKPNIRGRIEQAKEIVVKDKPPEELCYPDVPEGKAGNMKINRMCMYCPHKLECRKDANDGQGLRIFEYSSGKAYFSEVYKEPRVKEVT